VANYIETKFTTQITEARDRAKRSRLQDDSMIINPKR